MKRFVVLIGMVSLFQPFASTYAQDLILNLSGRVGSDLVTYEATGFITIHQNVLGLNSHLGLAPIQSIWTSSFDNNLGSMLNDSMDTGLNDDLPLSNGGVSYRKNGIEFGTLDSLDLDGSGSTGDDDIELDPTTSIDYPSLAAGDELSWSGSGTFMLEDGETFDSLFVEFGSFSSAIDGGNYVVNISLLGDINLDGLINLLDIEPFVDVLSSGGFQTEADINQDDVVNLLDIEPFVALLGSG